MLGLLIHGFSGLPVEEPILWLGVTWATVIVYEIIYTLLYVCSPELKPAPRTSSDLGNE
jgi:hypothetical protein